MSDAARSRDWRDPFTSQIWRDVPQRLAERLDAIAAAAAAHPAGSIASSDARDELRSQVKHLLGAFAWRVAYRRTLDEIHAGEDRLLPISDDRRQELERAAQTFAAPRP